MIPQILKSYGTNDATPRDMNNCIDFGDINDLQNLK